jgi:hypothetical protein
MFWRRWRARLRFGETVALLALLTALLVLAMSMWLRAFYRHDAKGYEPKDLERGKQLEMKKGREGE